MKDTPKKILVGAVNRLAEPLVRKCIGSFCPIFMIHRVTEGHNSVHGHSVPYLSQCLQYLRMKKYNILSLADLADLVEARNEIPKRSVVFTADDGFLDQAQLAAPLFSEYDAPMTFFLISSFLDQKIWPWDDQVKYVINNTKLAFIDALYPCDDPLSVNVAPLGDERKKAYDSIRSSLKDQSQAQIYEWLPQLFAAAEVQQPAVAPANYLPMQWEDAQKLIDNGHLVAPHTATHRILSQLDDSDSRSEILGSIGMLADRLKGASRLFAYPTGRPTDYGSREIAILKEAGVKAAVSTRRGAVIGASPQFELPRYALPTNFNSFIQCLGAFELLRSGWR